MKQNLSKESLSLQPYILPRLYIIVYCLIGLLLDCRDFSFIYYSLKILSLIYNYSFKFNSVHTVLNLYTFTNKCKKNLKKLL